MALAEAPLTPASFIYQMTELLLRPYTTAHVGVAAINYVFERAPLEDRPDYQEEKRRNEEWRQAMAVEIQGIYDTLPEDAMVASIFSRERESL